MMILITGANGSGKSAFAESLVTELPGDRYYIATMVAQTKDNQERIKKHRAQRAGLGFKTVERPWGLEQLRVPRDSLVLLEDVSNLLGNGLFHHKGTKEQALQQILDLQSRCGALICVTIGGLTEKGYSGETAAYIRDLNWLNDRLLEEADEAYEMAKDGVKWVK